jgi:hypothetical protein
MHIKLLLSSTVNKLRKRPEFYSGHSVSGYVGKFISQGSLGQFVDDCARGRLARVKIGEESSA